MMKNHKLPTKLKSIESIDEESLSVTLKFEGGKKRKVSLEKYFAQPKGLAAEVMRGDLFNQCFIEMGALAWPNGLELCADSLLLLAEQQRKAGAA